MKRFNVLFIILLVCVPSCKKQPEPQIDYIWIGQADRWDIANRVPVCIIWYKYVQPPTNAWKPYKTFNQNDAHHMREIILQLLKPEKNEPNPNLRTQDKLSLIFYSGSPEKLTIREVYFEIKGKTFIGPSGKSDKLGKILSEQQETQSIFYYPYSELGAGHYEDDFERILQINEYNQKLAEEQKTKRKTEAQREIEEANQAE